MKRYFKHPLLLALLAHAGLAQAQEVTPRTFTLQQAITHAVENNATVKNERLNLGIAEAQIKETLAQGLPQINATGNITYNPIVQTSFIDAGNFGGEAGTYMPVQFGLPYQGSAALSASQMIFNGSYFVGLRASKVFRELSERNVQKANVDVAEAVALAYYGALVSEERLKLLGANLQRLDTLYRETRIMNENGFVEAIDVQRLKVNLNNLRTEYDNVERSLALNLAALKFQMGIPMNQPIALAESIQDFEPGSLAADEAFQYQQRIEYLQLETTRKLAELDIKNTRVQYYPSLTAFANYGYNAAKRNFGELFEPTTVVMPGPVEGETVRMQVDTWNEYAAVGLNLNVPIFDGFLKANTIRRKKLLADQVENQMRNLENAIDLELEQARISLQNSLQSLETQQENMDLAQEVFRVSKIKYQQGVGSNLEVVEAENALKTAETNYYQALYNALIARVAYDKASGTLYTN
ncbi:TolC family protein [Cesiribacter andamanensis]|uniref:Putative efflux pump outer membrane protein ttgC n=1 Tax=Cesiribacter andamanensis AMV16 TaxID=1279009 RepID=M7NWI5_9BACT|nr:TolC family protein [Cesiribacter andamanensis]EMR02789.1 putative efflux pump outer membrane protein ttgC precursor [Cesiribacter andamanensis AMV16]